MYVITHLSIIFIYVIFYLRWVESCISKEKVLRTTDVYYTSYYCKDECCARVNSNYDEYIIEISDINKNVTKYIVYTCTYDQIESNKCLSYIAGANYTLVCNEDSECLSNKCYKNHCMYNDETPIVRCDDIYSDKWYSRKSSYMYCGKPPGDTCKENDECSSRECGYDNLCQYQDDGPSDSDGAKAFAAGVIIFGVLIAIIIIVIIICCCCYCRYKRNKK